MTNNRIIEKSIISVVLLLFFLFSLTGPVISQTSLKPLKILVSERVFFAGSYVKDEQKKQGVFSPFKEIQNADNKYYFEIYPNRILLKDKIAQSEFTIEKTELKYANTISIFTHDRFGRKFLIEYWSNKVDGIQSDNIDIIEFDNINVNNFKRMTKYVCRVL